MALKLTARESRLFAPNHLQMGLPRIIRRTIFSAMSWMALCAAAAQQTPAARQTPDPLQPNPQPPNQTATPTPDLPPASLAAQIAGLINAPAVSRDHWGILVTSLDGALIYGLNQNQLFQPASTAKLFSTAMALAMLGEDERFETQVIASGYIDKQGVLHGDLKLVGGGDPSFGTQDLPYVPPAQRAKTTSPTAPPPIADIEELADKVYATGLRRIEGNVVGDDWQIIWDPYPPEWSLNDVVYGYGAPVSALNVHDNEIEVKVAPDVKNGKATTQTDPDIPYYTIETQVYTEHMEGLPAPVCDLIGYQRAQGTKNLYIYMPIGALEPGQAPCTQAVAIADPAEYAAIAFKAALERRGVMVTGKAQAKHLLWRDPNPATGVDDFVPRTMPLRLKAPYERALPRQQCMAQTTSGGPQEPGQTVLATHESHPLSEDVTYTMKVSQNLHAEVLLRDVGAALSCAGTQRAALNALRLFLPHVGIQAGDFVLVDGSGLSSHDLVTPRATAQLLSYAAHDPKTGNPQPWFAAWKASLPIGGVDGTLADRFTQTPLKGHVFAKTGTMGEARALAGYLDAASGRTVIFSILVGNHLPGSNADRDATDKIVAAIAAAE
jgi:D-alanyl-D-alanine carboxypeptidase/D-alanyl-D-alanine-endopeptidase (penicillin-binding protein 4)